MVTKHLRFHNYLVGERVYQVFTRRFGTVVDHQSGEQGHANPVVFYDGDAEPVVSDQQEVFRDEDTRGIVPKTEELLRHFERMTERVIPEERRDWADFEVYQPIIHRVDNRYGAIAPPTFDDVPRGWYRVLWHNGPRQFEYIEAWRIQDFIAWTVETFVKNQ